MRDVEELHAKAQAVFVLGLGLLISSFVVMAITLGLAVYTKQQIPKLCGAAATERNNQPAPGSAAKGKIAEA